MAQVGMALAFYIGKEIKIMLNIQALIQEYFSGKFVGNVTHTFDNHYMVNVGRATAYFSIVNNSIVNVQFD